MLDSHGNISILLSEVVNELLLCFCFALRLNFRLNSERAHMRAKQTELNEIGTQ